MQYIFLHNEVQNESMTVYANHFYDTSVIFSNSIITYREPFTICIGHDLTICIGHDRRRDATLSNFLGAMWAPKIKILGAHKKIYEPTMNLAEKY